MINKSDDILTVFEDKNIVVFMNYFTFRQYVLLTYNSCSIEGSELSIKETAELIAEEILKKKRKNI